MYCHPVPPDEWPDQREIVERIRCARRGAAIDVVADRGRLRPEVHRARRDAHA